MSLSIVTPNSRWAIIGAVALLVVVGTMMTSTEAAKWSHQISTTDDYYFLGYPGRFCFDTVTEEQSRDQLVGEATFRFTVENAKNLKLLAYYDGQPNEGDIPTQGGSWVAALEATTCEEKVKLARTQLTRNITTETNGKDISFNIEGYVRPHFWFFALADCGNDKGINVAYDISYKNAPPSVNAAASFFVEFSYDERGVLEALIFFFIVFLVLAAAHGYGSYQLWREESYHTIVKILSVTIGLYFFGVFLQLIHYGAYSNDGIGAPFIRACGELFCLLSEVTFMFMLLLIAKGWTISSTQLPEMNTVFAAFVVAVLAYLILFIWAQAGANPAYVQYFYDSVPGVIVIILRMVGLVWTLWSIRNTIRMEALPEKRKFYRIFAIGAICWFLILPIIEFWAIVLDIPWEKFHLVTIVMLIFHTLGASMMVFLLWPSRVRDVFSMKQSPSLLNAEGQAATTPGDVDNQTYSSVPTDEV